MVVVGLGRVGSKWILDHFLPHFSGEGMREGKHTLLTLNVHFNIKGRQFFIHIRRIEIITTYALQ